MSSSKHRHQLDPQYAFLPRFENNLPEAPSGPFFQRVNMIHDFEKDYGAYRVSSLEKTYVYQPHMGADVGMQLSLVDPEKVLIDSNNVTNLHPDDVAILAATGDRKSKANGLDHHPSWLLHHVPVTRNIMNQVSDVKAAVQRRREGDLEALKAKVEEKDKVSYIEKSFASTAATVKNMQESSKNLSIEYVSDILPDFDMWESDRLTLIRYEENPLDGMDSSKFQVEKAITTNFQAEKFEGEWSCSLVAPLSSSSSSSSNSEDDDEEDPFGDDDSLEKATSNDKGKGVEGGMQLYEWMRNFRVRLDGNIYDDAFAFKIPSSGSDSGSKTAAPTLFCPMRSRLVKRRIKSETIVEHSCKVARRDYNEQEKDDFQAQVRELE